MLLLVALSLWTAPTTLAARDAPAHEGDRITLEARVLAASGSARGRHLVVADDTARLPVVAQPGALPQPGDRVRIVGLVARLDEGIGLSAERIEVLEGATTVDPSTLARTPALYEGARVLVRGEAREGALVGGGARVALTGEPVPAAGGAWLASGTFYYNTDHAAYALKVETWSRPS